LAHREELVQTHIRLRALPAPLDLKKAAPIRSEPTVNALPAMIALDKPPRSETRATTWVNQVEFENNLKELRQWIEDLREELGQHEPSIIDQIPDIRERPRALIMHMFRSILNLTELF